MLINLQYNTLHISLASLCIPGPLFLLDRYGFLYYLLLCSQDLQTTDLILGRIGDSAPNVVPNREYTYVLLSPLLHTCLIRKGVCYHLSPTTHWSQQPKPHFTTTLVFTMSSLWYHPPLTTQKTLLTLGSVISLMARGTMVLSVLVPATQYRVSGPAAGSS